MPNWRANIKKLKIINNLNWLSKIKMSYLNKEQIENIVACAKEAGQIAVDMQHSPRLIINTKEDGSKVTSADIAISHVIHEKLSAAFPQIPIICEEGTLRKAGDIFWLIDPIDGTSSYAQGCDEFAVNIALVCNNKPVFGLIYAPSFEGGKIAFSDDRDGVIVENNQSIFCNNAPEKLKIIASTRIKDEQVQRFIDQFYPNYHHHYQVEKRSSAVKFFRIIEGQADLYLHCRPSMEWDIASGQVLIELMGGQVKKLFSNDGQFAIGEKMTYNKPEFANSAFVASLNKDLVNG